MLETAGRLGDGAIVYATVQPDVLDAALAHVAAGAKAAGRALHDLDVARLRRLSARDGRLATSYARTDRLADLMALAGTPEEVRAQVESLHAVRGLSRVIVFPQVPGTEFLARETILTMFADEVLARLR
jgi:alkanesulfonate monooxygenase SsuD/methylene tetrahydromethanopterin reductase-like flavin-dependent oxidoreductase (luciferase family)